MAGQKILLPFNFTDMDRKSLEFFTKIFAFSKDCRVTLFHTYTPIPKIDTNSSTVMGRLSASMQYLYNQMKEKEEALAEARQHLIENGFMDNQVEYVFRPRAKQVADEIIDTVIEGRYEIIILNCRPYRITRLFMQSVHNKVVSLLKDVTVCIVT